MFTDNRIYPGIVKFAITSGILKTIEIIIHLPTKFGARPVRFTKGVVIQISAIQTSHCHHPLQLANQFRTVQ
ncbi:hypothetical protein AQ837_24500 [Burkholderia pseudomallei]|nr:hypothetical protein AQ730_00515 [Burkholderia pseudomallei]OMS89879.1 hypothetical protein AQ748_04500 [Burkholderia pseudomallei]OMU99873.1 hypothetical protein AQ784_05315 [Burkholderia pseudomallei]OMV08078.1 hypothetical protein AQ785_26675 [Burkholderia pseudomallei]OMW55962.1 hypothetical protein AQ812_16215 [Burkholderia pseudomallei]